MNPVAGFRKTRHRGLELIARDGHERLGQMVPSSWRTGRRSWELSVFSGLPDARRANAPPLMLIAPWARRWRNSPTRMLIWRRADPMAETRSVLAYTGGATLPRFDAVYVTCGTANAQTIRSTPGRVLADFVQPLANVDSIRSPAMAARRNSAYDSASSGPQDARDKYLMVVDQQSGTIQPLCVPTEVRRAPQSRS
jgi:hypothetical protein